MEREKLEKLIALIAKATPLPWAQSALAPLYVVQQGSVNVVCSLGEYNADGTIDGIFDQAKENLALIVAAVNALPQLLSELDAETACTCNDSSNEHGCPVHGAFYALLSTPAPAEVPAEKADHKQYREKLMTTPVSAPGNVDWSVKVPYCIEHRAELFNGRCPNCRDKNGKQFVLDLQSIYLDGPISTPQQPAPASPIKALIAKADGWKDTDIRKYPSATIELIEKLTRELESTFQDEEGQPEKEGE
jgi:hypothetical protein